MARKTRDIIKSKLSSVSGNLTTAINHIEDIMSLFVDYDRVNEIEDLSKQQIILLTIKQFIEDNEQTIINTLIESITSVEELVKNLNDRI